MLSEALGELQLVCYCSARNETGVLSLGEQRERREREEICRQPSLPGFLKFSFNILSLSLPFTIHSLKSSLDNPLKEVFFVCNKVKFFLGKFIAPEVYLQESILYSILHYNFKLGIYSSSIFLPTF